MLYRRSDGRLLGESINYRRDGGDPRWWVDYAGGHGTDYVCPKDGVAGSIELLNNVFIRDLEYTKIPFMISSSLKKRGHMDEDIYS
jgi:hypothetical protein